MPRQMATRPRFKALNRLTTTIQPGTESTTSRTAPDSDRLLKTSGQGAAVYAYDNAGKITTDGSWAIVLSS
jgi:hypothetical protein